MNRLGVLTTGLALLGLLCLPACDGGGDEGSDEASDGTDSADGMDDTAGDTAGDTGGMLACGDEWAEKDGMTESIMDDWGLPCMSDADCTAALGDTAVCVTDILGVYELPGGYCSKLDCELPDNLTTFVLDAEDCDPNGGIACIGVAGTYTVCAEPCDNSSQCGREGYGCRIMPNIASEGDPTFCLMDPEACCAIEGGGCV